MKAAGLLFSVGLASAQILSNSTGIFSNSSNSLTSPSFDIGGLNLGGLVDLNNLNVNGLNLGNIDLGNQDAIVDAILAMLVGFCLGGQLNRNNILGFGFNNDVDLFFQLAQLRQFQQLGFIGLGGVQNLFNKGKVLGGFNLGLFKREIADARKTMKRTILRRGQNVRRQSCAQGVGSGAIGSGFGGQEEAAFTIATAENPALETATATAAADFAITTVDPEVNDPVESVASADLEAVLSIATANPDVVVGAASVAPASSAAAVTSSVTTTPVVASASALVQAFTTIAPVVAATPAPVAAPVAVETVIPVVAVEDVVDNLSNLTR